MSMPFLFVSAAAVEDVRETKSKARGNTGSERLKHVRLMYMKQDHEAGQNGRQGGT